MADDRYYDGRGEVGRRRVPSYVVMPYQTL
ncbi:uncharacterized protein G2W53_027498 [Senna tora]|uniref:Uncharacterized protein n=1 Tax=Senna tora TaxID=362788 RepID=A0A834TH11_9FABA|nr:uncharacterized protein G2W53_027498 [Senna tora]